MLSFPIPEFCTEESGHKEILNNFIFQLSAADVDSYISDKSAQFNPLRCTNKDCNLILTHSLINNDNKTCHICKNKLPSNLNNIASPLNKVICNISKIQKNIENYIIICFDTSSSMNKQYPGKNPQKCRYQIFLEKLFEALSELEQNSPLKYHLFLITFNDKVTLYGDLVSSNPVEIKTSLNISEMIKEASERSPALCKANLKESLKFLPTLMNDKDNGLYFETFCQGETALGNALAVSLGVVKGFKSNYTQTIILTDGYCNKGLLDMEFLRVPEEYKELSVELEEKLIQELEEIAEIAFSLNTYFHIFGFEDEEIFLCHLRKIIDYNKQGEDGEEGEEGEGVMYKIPIDNNGANEKNFLEELKKCFKIFESKLGVNAHLKLVTNNNVKIRKREKTLVNASNIQENNFILDLNLGVLAKKNIFSFRYELLGSEYNCNNVIKKSIKYNKTFN